MRVLVVDDEPLARMRVEDLLAAQPDVEVVGSAADGDAAISAIRELKPDLVFLDVQMPVRTGVDVIREVGAEHMPVTIFVTAYDKYALSAFETAAVDYLVKPFDDERFEQALSRARRFIELERLDELRDKLVMLLQPAPSAAGGTPEASMPREASSAELEVNAGLPEGQPAAGARHGWLERIAVDMRGKVRVVQVADIDYILASGPYVQLYVGGRPLLLRESLQSLEDRLNPAMFMRVHRSAIVRLDLVEVLHKGAGGDYEVQLKGGARIKVSRSRREELERALGVVEP